MTSADFDTQFNRLTGHFHLPVDASRETVGLDWFRAVEHYHIDALELAVTELIRSAQDRFWPPLGKMLSTLRGRLDKYERTGKCATCHGSTWIDSAPFKSNGMVYQGVVVRCPDCAIPSPHYTAPGHREGLTASEYAQWAQGDHAKDYMPAGCKAHPFKAEDQTEIRAAMNRLHLKLFGRALHAKASRSLNQSDGAA